MLENVVLRHDNGIITDISERSAARHRAAHLRPSRLRQRPRPCAADRVVVRRASACRWKAGSCAPRSARRPIPISTAASALARSARAGCASMMVHYTRPSGTMPLVEEAKAIARAANDVGIRIAFALAVRDQNPVVYGDGEPVLSGLSRDDRKTIEELFVRAPMSPQGLYRADRCDRRRDRRPQGRRAARARRRAMVLEAAAGSGRRELGADRPPHSHASAGDHLSARLGRPAFSRRHRPLSPRHRLPVGTADAGALHPCPAGRDWR